MFNAFLNQFQQPKLYAILIQNCNERKCMKFIIYSNF